VSSVENRLIGVSASRFGWAWMALCVALAVHVADEALTGFLSVYNPVVESVRERFPHLPIPTFEFGTWLTGLILAILILIAASPLAFRESRWAVRAGYAFGMLMLANGLLHIIGSISLGRLLPGVYSAPLLVGCSGYLLSTAFRASTRVRRNDEQSD
jgi:hypothetical protein